MLKYLSILAFILLLALAAGRGMMLRRKGINAFLFGATDKSDFLLTPVVAFFFYAILSPAFGLPIPVTLAKPFFVNPFLNWCGLAVCGVSLIWFALTLKSFGDSFRIGIDGRSPDKLVTIGMFAISRNPIYVAFISFILGMFIINPNTAVCTVLVLFIAVIHRQVLKEEQFLKIHYGKEYEDYCRHVRRYL